MRDLNCLNQYRKSLRGHMGNGTCGAFKIPIGNRVANVIASSSDGGEHVSVSLDVDRCPKWNEMGVIKDLFFHETECVMQLHGPVEEHINNHDYCLHLWKPIDNKIPWPTSYMVGFKGVGVLK